MRTRSSSHLIFIVCLILALSLIAAGCAPAQSTPRPHTQQAEGTPTALTAPLAHTAAPTEVTPVIALDVKVMKTIAQPGADCPPLKTARPETPVFITATASDCFVDRQILVIGLPTYFDSEPEPEAVKGLVALQIVDLTELVQKAAKDNDGFQLPPFSKESVLNHGLRSVLFEMSAEDARTLDQAIAAFDESAKAGLAYADPNYLIGEPSTEAFPNGVVGSAFGDAAGAPGGFLGQWAFSQIDLTDPASTGLQTDNAISIGVFDTFPDPLNPEGAAEYLIQVLHNGNPKASLSMCVKGPSGNATIVPVRTTPIADHGVFGAYLAQTVAPGSKITLYRVLNDFGDGDLGTLFRALSDFMSTPSGSNAGVINLSLGLHWYPETKWPKQCGSAWNTRLAAIEHLDVQLRLARYLGYVVVAAAGNGANNAASPPKVVPPDLPASMDTVIGVAASSNTDGGKLACFSNWAADQILAPGGEGRDVINHNCDPPPGDCEDHSDVCLKESLISLMPTSPTGYGYWTGTSFAAPLVSGLAARCIQQHDQSTTRWTGTQAADGAWNAISTGASSPGRVINVPATLAECGK